MRASDAAKCQYIETLAAILGSDSAADLKVEVEIIERRYFRDLERRLRCAEAARLLPLGAEVVAERQNCHRVTAYRRAARGKVVALLFPVATTA